MDIHELRQFESVYKPSKEVAFCWLRKQYVQLSTEENHTEIVDHANDSLRIWQAAKAQAVPEGFILIKASDRNREILELIDQRDYMGSQAEELKDKLQALYGVDFGEHSNCNFPFQNAIDYDDFDFVLVKKNHLSEVVEKIERMFEEDSLLALGELLPIQQGIKAMIEAQEPAND
jgi:hypothetical protein